MAFVDNERARLAVKYGEPVMSSDEMRERFVVRHFLAPYVMVTEKATGKQGTLMFQHMPRFYFNWQED